MAIVTQEYYEEKTQNQSIVRFSKEFGVNDLLKKSNIRKAKGVGVLVAFILLLSVAFSGKPLSKRLTDEGMAGSKDVIYRFMNSTSANWYKFIRLLSARIITRIKVFYEGSGVMVLDDTIHKRNRSKNVELLTRVRDHNDGRYYRGFRCLTLCFHQGKATVPMDFRLLSSVSRETRINELRQGLDKRSNGYKRREFAVSNSFQMAFDMISRQRGLCRHVLFDSWFAMPIMFKKLLGMGFHGIGMLKASKALYYYKGKAYNLEALYGIVKPFLHYENQSATLGVAFRDGTPFSITFVFDKRNKRDWLAIGTTDLTLSSSQVISLYARRWNIEVFFKTVKSYLGFARECQSRSFDAIVCSVTVVFTRHMILTWLNLGMPVPQTDGQLFFRLFDEIHEVSFDEALTIVFRELQPLFSNNDELLSVSIRDFFLALPLSFRCLKTVSICES